MFRACVENLILDKIINEQLQYSNLESIPRRDIKIQVNEEGNYLRFTIHAIKLSKDIFQCDEIKIEGRLYPTLHIILELCQRITNTYIT